MQLGMFLDLPNLARGRSAPRQPWWLSGLKILVCLAALAPLSGVAQSSVMNTNGHTLPPIVTDPPDKNAQMEMHQQQKEQQKKDFAAANTERKKQIANDSEKLLKLATDLKEEVDKTNKDTLSLNVIRKAEAIEKLAHDVKEKMKLTAGPG